MEGLLSRLLYALGLVTLVVASCTPEPRVGDVREGPLEVPPSTSAPGVVLAPLQVDPGCAVVFHANWTSTDDGRRALSVVDENVSPHGVEFVLPDRCPTGAVDFEGLPAGFDYYGTCNMGACPGPRSPQHVSLDPGGRRQIAQALVDVAASACNRALAPGYYQVRPVLPVIGVAACVEAAGLDLRGEMPPAIGPAPRPAPPTPPAVSVSPPIALPSARPAAPPPPVDPLYACTTAADCVLSCPTPPGCCGWSCGCTNAIRRDHADAFAASYARSCTRPPRCLAVDCAYQLAVGATCRNGRCAAATGPGQM